MNVEGRHSSQTVQSTELKKPVTRDALDRYPWGIYSGMAALFHGNLEKPFPNQTPAQQPKVAAAIKPATPH